MIDLQAARIRLEGQLEVIESATRLLDASLSNESARIAAWAEQHLPAVLEAESLVGAMAKDAPALKLALSTLKVARERFERTVRERMELLQLPVTSLGVGLLALAAEPVRFIRCDRMILTARRTIVFVLPLLVCTVASSSEHMTLLCAIGASLIIALAIAEYLTLMTLIVTSKRLITHKRSVSLTDIKAVKASQPRWYERDRRMRIEIEQDGGSDTLRFHEWPTQLLAALRAGGVQIDDA